MSTRRGLLELLTDPNLYRIHSGKNGVFDRFRAVRVRRKLDAGYPKSRTRNFAGVDLISNVSGNPSHISADIPSSSKTGLEDNLTDFCGNFHRVIMGASQVNAVVVSILGIAIHVHMHIDQTRQAGVIPQINNLRICHRRVVARKNLRDTFVANNNDPVARCRLG